VAPGPGSVRRDLTLPQLIAVNLRLTQSVVVSATVNGVRRESRVGLGGHLDAHHAGRCYCGKPTPQIQIDYHGGNAASHPHDYVSECPAVYHDEGLATQVYEAIAIEDAGGLTAYAGEWGGLPVRVVSFYRMALAARDRFVAQRESTLAGLYRK
jgi:hypothetical protein